MEEISDIVKVFVFLLNLLCFYYNFYVYFRTQDISDIVNIFTMFD